MVTIGNGAVLAQCGRTDDGSRYGKMNWNPCARNLDKLDGACALHFGGYESVNGTTGHRRGGAGAGDAGGGGGAGDDGVSILC